MMEDSNNNIENCAFVPDFLLPDLFTSKDLFPMDEQSVPVFDQMGPSPADIDQLAASPWYSEQPDPSHREVDQGALNQPYPAQPYQVETASHYNVNAAGDDGALLPSTSGGALPQSAAAPELETNPAAAATPTTSSPVTSPLCCPVCYRTFRHKLGLTNHQRVHTAKHPHLCSICGETFKYKTNFKRHRRVHAKEMKICRYCGDNMESDYDLVQHEKEHRRQQRL